MLLENQLGALGVLIQDRMDRVFGDLSPRASSLLITLRCRGPLTVSILAVIVAVSQPTATRLIGGLEKRGYVRRAARDGRNVTVSLTSPGRERAESLQTMRAGVASAMVQPLEGKEREALERLIEKILYAATESRAAARTSCRYCDHGVCGGDDCPINRRATEIEQASSAHQRQGISIP